VTPRIVRVSPATAGPTPVHSPPPKVLRGALYICTSLNVIQLSKFVFPETCQSMTTIQKIIVKNPLSFDILLNK
jgi:hypothetical protein